jgi:SAM-dependent methyltransferase
MSDPANDRNVASEDGVGNTLYKKDFWSEENLKYSRPHYRMEKAARLINKLARDQERTLLDVGCGPATLRSLLKPNIQYHGIDIAIQNPAPNLIEADFLEAPVKFDDKRFDIILAQGVFEYVGNFQSQKFAEIAQLLTEDGVFVVSYVNFDHRHREVYWPYSNVQPFSDFRRSLAENFTIRKFFPTAYNWNHWEPGRKILRAANMHINVNIPVIGPVLAVEYFLICSARKLI